MRRIVYLNDKFSPITEAKISVLDRGFLFGDGVYEVVSVYSGKPFHLNEHLQRLQHSLDAIKLPLNVCEIDFAKIIAELLQLNSANQGDHSLYIQITRGVAEERTHNFPQQVTPTVFLMTKPIKPISYEELSRGKKAITQLDIRWKYCHIKSTSLLPSILLFQAAVDAGCDEAILIRDGYAIEGTSSNIFIVKNSQIITPPLSQENLSGVTRDLILQILRNNALPFQEKNIAEQELFEADEVWISSSTRGIFPIIELNGKAIGNGVVGPLWQKVMQLYLKSNC